MKKILKLILDLDTLIIMVLIIDKKDMKYNKKTKYDAAISILLFFYYSRFFLIEMINLKPN